MKKIRLGRFDKWGYKNSFSKGELARELVYTNEENDNLKQVLNEIRCYINKNTNFNPIDNLTYKLFIYKKEEYEFIEDILQIIDKCLGDEQEWQ